MTEDDSLKLILKCISMFRRRIAIAYTLNKCLGKIFNGLEIPSLITVSKPNYLLAFIQPVNLHRIVCAVPRPSVQESLRIQEGEVLSAG